MRPVAWSHNAQRDVSFIRKYIAQFSPDAAHRISMEIYDSTELLKQYPHAGQSLPGGRRRIVTGKYIIYRVYATETRILNVWHGAQNWS